MNNDRYVSDDVRARVLQAVEELQYVPNVMARSFRSGQDTAIGVAVPALTGSSARSSKPSRASPATAASRCT